MILTGPPAAAFASVCLLLSVDDVVDLLVILFLDRPSLVIDSEGPKRDTLLDS